MVSINLQNCKEHSLGWTAGLKTQDLSPVTTRGYRHDLDRFRRWIEEHRGAIPLGQITARST
jgi:hypothetical protein